MRARRTSSGGVVDEHRSLRVAAPAPVTWGCVADLGGAPGWYAASRLWRLRFRLDGLLGGPGLRPRPDRPLRVGDPVEGWRVSELVRGRRLGLTSEVRMPGTAVLTYEVQPATPPGQGSVLVQHLRWVPRGVAGRILWTAELPAHVVVLRAMLHGTAREAERRAAAAAIGGR